MLKHVNLISFLSILTLGCSDNSAEKEINNLKAEIERLQENKKFAFFIIFFFSTGNNSSPKAAAKSKEVPH